MATNYPTSLDSASGGNPFGFANARNFLSTTLSGAHTSAVTTITVASTTNFPTRGLISIDTEVISYTGTTATTFTGCTRGADSTTAASHSDAATVAQVPTALNHNDVTGAIVAVETKLGTGSSTASANTVLRGTGAGATSFGQIVNGDITTNTIVAPNKIADGGANTVLGSNGSTPTWRQVANGDIATNTIAAPNKIADGGANTVLGSNGTTPTWRQVATGDIAANAITQRPAAAVGTTSPTTTSATAVDLADPTVTLTRTGGDLMLWACGTFDCTTVNAIVALYVKLDAGAHVKIAEATIDSASAHRVSMTGFQLLTGVSAASHTITLGWSTNAGTATAYASVRRLMVVEVKK